MPEEAEATVTQMPSQSLRDKIKAHPQSKGEIVEVPEWEVDVELRSMSLAQKATLLGGDTDDLSNMQLFMPEVVIYTAYDPATGNPIFTAEDLDYLKNEPANVIEELATKGLKVSGMDAEAAAEKKDAS